MYLTIPKLEKFQKWPKTCQKKPETCQNAKMPMWPDFLVFQGISISPIHHDANTFIKNIIELYQMRYNYVWTKTNIGPSLFSCRMKDKNFLMRSPF